MELNIYNCIENLYPEFSEMETNIISGKRISKKIRNSFQPFLSKNKTPVLAVLNTGIDEASNYYVHSQKKIFNKNGLEVIEVKINPYSKEEEYIKRIHELNQDSQINGIQAQIPLPNHIRTQRVLDTISPEKDVDCQSSFSLGRIMTGDDCDYYPNTAFAVKFILNYYGIDLSTKSLLILNRGNVVGKPLAMMLLDKNSKGNGSPLICHSRTKHLNEFLRESDIIVIAIGRAHWLKSEHVKSGAIVIDVGINSLLKDGKQQIVGDADTDQLLNICKYITPVPNGVGSVTTSLLMYQTVLASYIQSK